MIFLYCVAMLKNKKHQRVGDSLDVDVGADDVLDLLRKWILKGEGAGSEPDPLSGFRAKPVHD